VHYVVLGIDAPPLNDDDGDGVPDYVERVGEAADVAIGYFERRGFRAVRPDTGGPDGRPDLYVSRFAPGSFGISFPASAAEGGAYAAVANNLDPSATASLASLYGTVAHELFHLTQFSYFPATDDPEIPSWVLEGTAAAMEQGAFPELDDIVSALQQREWFVAADRPLTEQSYGAQLLWRYLDDRYPRLVDSFLGRLAAERPAGEGRAAFVRTFASVTGSQFADVFLGYALRVASDAPERIRPRRTLQRGTYRSAAPPFAVHYLVLARGTRYVVRFARRPATAALTYELASDVAGNPSRTVRVAPTLSGGGRTLTFRIPSALRRNSRLETPLLVITNGRAAGRIGYRVTIR
jgi:hypothetical protein